MVGTDLPSCCPVPGTGELTRVSLGPKHLPVGARSSWALESLLGLPFVRSVQTFQGCMALATSRSTCSNCPSPALGSPLWPHLISDLLGTSAEPCFSSAFTGLGFTSPKEAQCPALSGEGCVCVCPLLPSCSEVSGSQMFATWGPPRSVNLAPSGTNRPHPVTHLQSVIF